MPPSSDLARAYADHTIPTLDNKKNEGTTLASFKQQRKFKTSSKRELNSSVDPTALEDALLLLLCYTRQRL